MERFTLTVSVQTMSWICTVIWLWVGKIKQIKEAVTTYQSQNTKKGMITGGFDRVNLFQQAEEGFDKLFNNNCSKLNHLITTIRWRTVPHSNSLNYRNIKYQVYLYLLFHQERTSMFTLRKKYKSVDERRKV